MFIKRTKKVVKGKKYVNHLRVESVATPKGPRHRILCSLGSLDPGPKEQWLSVAKKIEAALGGQPLLQTDETVEAIVKKIRSATAAPAGGDVDFVSVKTTKIEIEQAREAGPVHVGHQMWKKLGVDEVLAGAGLSATTRRHTRI